MENSDLFTFQIALASAVGNVDCIECQWKTGAFRKIEQFFVVNNKKINLLNYKELNMNNIKDICLYTLLVLEKSIGLKNCPDLFADPDRFIQNLNINCGLLHYSMLLFQQKKDRSLFDHATMVLKNFLQKNIDFFPSNFLKGKEKGAFEDCRNSVLRDIVAEEISNFEPDMKRKAACLIGLMHYKEEFDQSKFPNVFEVLRSALDVDSMDENSLDVITSYFALALNEKNAHLFIKEEDDDDDYFILLTFRLLKMEEEDKLRYGIILLASIVRGYACEVFKRHNIVDELVILLERLNKPECAISWQLVSVILINVIRIIESLGNPEEFLFKDLFLLINQKISDLEYTGQREIVNDTFIIHCLKEEEDHRSLSPGPTDSSSSSSFFLPSQMPSYDSHSFTVKTPPPSSLSESLILSASFQKTDFLKVRRFLKIKYEKLLLDVLGLQSGARDEKQLIVNKILHSHLLQLLFSYKDGEENLLPRIVEPVSELLYTLHSMRFDDLYLNDFLKLNVVGDHSELDAVLKKESNEKEIEWLTRQIGTTPFAGKNDYLLTIIFFIAYGYNLEEHFPQCRQPLLFQLQQALELSSSSLNSRSSSGGGSISRVQRTIFASFIFCSFKSTGNAAVLCSSEWFIQKLFTFLSVEAQTPFLWPVASSFLHLMPYNDDKEQILTRLNNNPRFLPLLGDLIDIAKTPSGEKRELVVTNALAVVNFMSGILQAAFNPQSLLDHGFFKHTATLFNTPIAATAVETKYFPSVSAVDDHTHPHEFNFPCLLPGSSSSSSSSSFSSTGLDLSSGVHAALFEVIEKVAGADPFAILEGDVPKNIVGMILVAMKKGLQKKVGLIEKYANQLLEICEHTQVQCDQNKDRVSDVVKTLKDIQFLPQIYLLFARPEFHTQPGFAKILMSLALSILILHSFVPGDDNITPVINYVATSFENDADPDEEVKKKLTTLITLTTQVTNITFLNNSLLAQQLVGLFRREDCPESLFLLFLLIAGLVKYESEEMKEMCDKFVKAGIFIILGQFTDFHQHANKYSFVQAIYLQLLTPAFFPDFLENDTYDINGQKSCIFNFVDFVLVYFDDFSNEERMQNPVAPPLPPPELQLALRNNFTILLRLVVNGDKQVRERLVQHNIIRALLNVFRSGINFELDHIYWALYMLSIYALDGLEEGQQYNKYFDKFMQIPGQQASNNEPLLEYLRRVYRLLVNFDTQNEERRKKGTALSGSANEQYREIGQSQTAKHHIAATYTKFQEMFSGIALRALHYVPSDEKKHVFLKTPDEEKDDTRLLRELIELCLIIMFSVKKGKELERAYITYRTALTDDTIFIEHATLFTKKGLLYTISEAELDD